MLKFFGCLLVLALNTSQCQSQQYQYSRGLTPGKRSDPAIQKGDIFFSFFNFIRNLRITKKTAFPMGFYQKKVKNALIFQFHSQPENYEENSVFNGIFSEKSRKCSMIWLQRCRSLGEAVLWRHLVLSCFRSFFEGPVGPVTSQNRTLKICKCLLT